MTDDARTPHGAERRGAPRFNVSLPITFTVLDSRRICNAVVDNISLGGVLLLTHEALDHGNKIVIHLPAAGDSTINVAASVIRTSSVGEFGVAFIALSDKDMDRLSEFLEQRAGVQ